MARGRPLKSEEEKERAGTKRRDRDRGDAPQVEPAILPPPPHLSAGAKKEWRRLMPPLSRSGLFTPLDAGSLEAYCVSYDLAAQAVRQYSGNPAMVIDLPNGFKQANPLLEIMTRFYKLAADFGARFGLDPISRSRLRVRKPTPDEKNPVERLRRQRSA